MAPAKNSTTFSSTFPISPVPPLFPLMPITRVSTIIPSTSSMIAALTIVVPTVSLSLPISFRAATVIETEVADMIVPMNRPFMNCGEPKSPKP